MDIFGTPSPTELGLLGSRLAVTYFLLLVVARLMGRRVPEPKNRDLIVSAVLGGLVAPALIRPEDTPLAALAGIVFLFSLHVLVSKLAFRSAWVEWLFFGPERVLVAQGRLIRSELRREGITVSELNSIARSHGVEALEAVDALTLGASGAITISTRPDAVLADILRVLERLEKRFPPVAQGR